MSESIHAGYLPLWNPYINFGIPQYGDMSSGYWSPVTWLIAATVGYNAYTLTIEILLYILIGAIGMYKLTGIWNLNKNVRIIASISFMCCGFNVAHLQHFNWLSGAAFLPWCFWGYILFLDKFTLKNTIRIALLFYFLVSSAHPGIIISAFYFFSGYLLFSLFEPKLSLSFKQRLKQISIAHFVFIIIVLSLCAGLISGYLDILPYFVRSEKISLSSSLSNPTNIQSWISILFPFPTVKNNTYFATDISMRNCYFGLVLLLFFLVSLLNKKNRLQFFLLGMGLAFALLSTGGIFKIMAYRFIPFMGYIRLNGEFRIFTILCFILIGSIELDRFVQQKKSFKANIQWIYYAIQLIIITVILIGVYKTQGGKDSFLYNLKFITSQIGVTSKLKALIDSISFYDTLWIQGIFQLIILFNIRQSLKTQNWNLLQKIVTFDLIIACLLNIPFTGVGKASVAQLQHILNKSPKGIPIPKLLPINNNDTISLQEEEISGDWSFYNKQIGTAKQIPYPIVLKNMQTYFERNAITRNDNYLDKPYIFATDSSVTLMNVQSFAPQKINLVAISTQTSSIVLQQNFYPHWYYNNGTQLKETKPYGINFMSAPILKGQNHISFIFEPTMVKRAMLLSLIAFVSCCLLLLPFKKRNQFLHDK